LGTYEGGYNRNGFPLAEGAVDGLDLGIACANIVGLLDASSEGSLDMTVEVSAVRGRDREADSVVVTGVSEGGAELRAAVDLDGFDGERLRRGSVEEVCGGGGGGLEVNFDHITLADYMSAGEPSEHDGGQGMGVEGT
jgi:hypothetical protein